MNRHSGECSLGAGHSLSLAPPPEDATVHNAPAPVYPSTLPIPAPTASGPGTSMIPDSNRSSIMDDPGRTPIAGSRRKSAEPSRDSTFNAKMRSVLGRLSMTRDRPPPLEAYYANQAIWDKITISSEGEDARQARFYYTILAAIRSLLRQLREASGRNPVRVVFIPLLVFCILVAGGVFGVHVGWNIVTDLAVNRAEDAGTFMASGLEQEIALAGSLVTSVAAYIELHPDYSDLSRDVRNITAKILQRSDAFIGSILNVELFPQGILTASYPNASLDYPVGFNVFEDLNLRPWFLHVLQTGTLALVGPVDGHNSTVRQLRLVRPVYVSGAAEGETFGAPGNPFAINSTDLYRPANQEALWGFVVGAMQYEPYVQQSVAFKQLRRKNFSFRLTREADGDLDNGVPFVFDTHFGDSKLVLLDDFGNLKGPQAHVLIQLPEVVWQLHVNGRLPFNFAPLLTAAVVVFSALIGLLLQIILVQSVLVTTLLSRMMPKNVLRRLQVNEQFVKPYNGVSVLFTDVVAFTTISSKVDAMDVVGLITEMNELFEGLCMRHSATKIDIIGDALFAVAGCPEVEPAEVAAARLAELACDFLAELSTVVLNERFSGYKLEIRAGIHSGPVVAATIGKQVPRFSIFGDTVNVASRMESSGAPHRLHVSEATAALLSRHFPDRFKCIPRGETDVKGKGSMPTFFVERSPGIIRAYEGYQPPNSVPQKRRSSCFGATVEPVNTRTSQLDGTNAGQNGSVKSKPQSLAGGGRYSNYSAALPHPELAQALSTRNGAGRPGPGPVFQTSPSAPPLAAAPSAKPLAGTEFTLGQARAPQGDSAASGSPDRPLGYQNGAGHPPPVPWSVAGASGPLPTVVPPPHASAGARRISGLTSLSGPGAIQLAPLDPNERQVLASKPAEESLGLGQQRPGSVPLTAPGRTSIAADEIERSSLYA